MEKLNEHIQKLEEKRNDFVVKHGQLKDSNGHAWDDIKSGIEKDWNEFEDCIERANAHFKQGKVFSNR